MHALIDSRTRTRKWDLQGRPSCTPLAPTASCGLSLCGRPPPSAIPRPHHNRQPCGQSRLGRPVRLGSCAARPRALAPLRPRPCEAAPPASAIHRAARLCLRPRPIHPPCRRPGLLPPLSRTLGMPAPFPRRAVRLHRLRFTYASALQPSAPHPPPISPRTLPRLTRPVGPHEGLVQLYKVRAEAFGQPPHAALQPRGRRSPGRVAQQRGAQRQPLAGRVRRGGRRRVVGFCVVGFCVGVLVGAYLRSRE
jgi:hypothetical protein